MNIPTVAEQTNAAKHALNEFDHFSSNVMEEQDTRIISLLVALQFLCDEEGHDFALLLRTAVGTYRNEAGK